MEDEKEYGNLRKHRRDIFGDGHGFVNVSQGGPRSTGRVPIVDAEYRFRADLHNIPMDNKPFLGLYGQVGGEKRAVIIWRATKPTAGLRFLTLEGSQAPHYVTDPLAWAELPKW